MSLIVVAHITAKAETVEATKEMLLGLIPPTRQETGCVRYQLHQNNADPRDFTFVEEWCDDQALNDHLQTPHLQQALARIPELLDGPPDIRRYTLIA